MVRRERQTVGLGAARRRCRRRLHGAGRQPRRPLLARRAPADGHLGLRLSDAQPITTPRLTLVVLDAPVLALMASGASPRPFAWPAWWPDDEDRGHIELWRRRVAEPDA